MHAGLRRFTLYTLVIFATAKLSCSMYSINSVNPTSVRVALAPSIQIELQQQNSLLA